MPHGHITVGPTYDREKMVLEMVVEGGPAVSVDLDAPKVDDLIEKLGFARARLRDRTLPERGPLTVVGFTVVNPAWRASADMALQGPQADSIALGLRHPNYDWLTFVLPDSDARTLAQWIIDNTTAERSEGTP